MRWVPATLVIVLLGTGAAAQPLADPPALVGQLARVQGTVSQHGAGADRWEPAVPNFPVTAGSALWTEPGAQADLGIAGSRIVLDGGTQLDIGRLDPTGARATLARGEAYLHLVAGTPPTELRTPRGTAQLTVPGRYGLAVGDTDRPTVLTVMEGEARFTGQGVDQRAGAGQAITIAGTDPSAGTVGPGQPDAFLAAQLARERPARPQAAAPPQAVRAMTGWQALEEYGQWRPAPEYGVVWYPDAGTDYVPYRQGRWAWVAPWGWTWVDDAPWGFAPSHYGRWVRAEDRWAWAPVLPTVPVGVVPVYAPAMVSFVDVAGAALIGAGLGYAVGARRTRPVGWVPLGWQEPYVPPYRASPDYLRRVNATNVTNVTNVTSLSVRNTFINRAAATVVPGEALTRFQPVAAAARPLPDTAALRPVIGRPVLAPTAASAGLTPAVARQFRLARPAFPPAPGPTVQNRPFMPGGAVRAALPGPMRPGEPSVVGGMPLLRAPVEPGGPGPGQPRPVSAPSVERQPGAAVPRPPGMAGLGREVATPVAPGPRSRPAEAAPSRREGARTEFHAPAAVFRAPAASQAFHPAVPRPAPPQVAFRPAAPQAPVRPGPPPGFHPVGQPPSPRPLSLRPPSPLPGPAPAQRLGGLPHGHDHRP